MIYRSKTSGRFVKRAYAKRYPGRVRPVVIEEAPEPELEEEVWDVLITVDYV